MLLVEGADRNDGSKSDIRKLVFERLNTGGQHLNAQELRNCLYAGGFNDLLIKLAGERLFTDIWGIPAHETHIDKHKNVAQELQDDPLYRRMLDCELVLRFFAFRKRSNIKGSVRSMLDRCMEEQLDLSDKELANLEKDFKTRLALAQEVFGTYVFQYKGEDGQGHQSKTLYDGIMVALDRLWEHRERIKTKKNDVRERVAELLKDEDAFEVIIGRPNTAKAVQKRMDLLTKTIKV